jgi:hypothetical protein
MQGTMAEATDKPHRDDVLVVEECEAEAAASSDQLAAAETILARLLVKRWLAQAHRGQAGGNVARNALDLCRGECPDVSGGSEHPMQERADLK